MAEKMLTNWFAFLLHKFLKVRLGVRQELGVESKMGAAPLSLAIRAAWGPPP